MTLPYGGTLPTSGGEQVFRLAPWDKSGRTVDNCYAYAMGDHSRWRDNKSIPGDRSGMSAIFRDYRTCGDLAKRVVSDNPKKVRVVHPNQKCLNNYYKVMMFVAPTSNNGNGNQTTGDFHFYKQHSLLEHKVEPGDTYASIARKYGTTVTAVKAGRVRNGPSYRTSEFNHGRYPPVGKTLRFRVNLFSHKQGWATGPLLRDAAGRLIRDPRKANRNYPGSMNYSLFCSAFCVKNKGVEVDAKDERHTPGTGTGSGVQNMNQMRAMAVLLKKLQTLRALKALTNQKLRAARPRNLIRK